jgi:hypothetical protein
MRTRSLERSKWAPPGSNRDKPSYELGAMTNLARCPLGVPGGGRTHTEPILNRLPLPVGLPGHAVVPAIGFEPTLV